MKKTKLIVAIFVIILGALTITKAASTSVKFKGEDKIVAEKEEILTIEISNNEKIGVINGIISYDSNIKDVKIDSSYNGWMVTYNEETGQFNALKAEGETNGEVLKITYKLKESASQGLITLQNIELTTISYETIKIDQNISKTISKTTETNKNNNENTTKTIKNTNVTKTGSRKHIGKKHYVKNNYYNWYFYICINYSFNSIIQKS